MIIIKDKKTGETWKILEKGDKSSGNEIKNDFVFTIPLRGYDSKTFNCMSDAISWVQTQVLLRRDSKKAPAPATFWDP